MKAIFVLLSASAVLASRGSHSPVTYSPSLSPEVSLAFIIIFGVCLLINILWIIFKLAFTTNHNPSDVEQQSLVGSTLPPGVVSTNITVSAKNRPSLLGELRHDENLVWAHETKSQYRRSVIFLLVPLFFILIGLATSIVFYVFVLDSGAIVYRLWIPFLGMACFVYCAVGITSKSASRPDIYALTSKRVFILSHRPPIQFGSKVETVRAYDLDGIHQTTILRNDDGSGTLTFSAAAIADGVFIETRGSRNNFAFTNIPNVTAVKDLIEQYKTLRKKRAGNQ